MATKAAAIDFINGGWVRSLYHKNSVKFNGVTLNASGLDVDGYYGYQCYDLFNAYCSFLGLAMVHSPYAYSIWTLAGPEWTRTQDGQPGDVAVFSGAINGGPGHVCLVKTYASRDNWTSTDQNWNNPSQAVGSPPAEIRHNARYLLGFLRPPYSDPTPNGDNDMPISKDDATALIRVALGYDPDLAQVAAYTGLDPHDALHAVIDGQQRKDLITMRLSYLAKFALGQDLTDAQVQELVVLPEKDQILWFDAHAKQSTIDPGNYVPVTETLYKKQGA